MNNKLLILLFTVILLAYSVSAVPSIEFVSSSMTMGDANKDVSNPNHGSESSRVVNLTGTITLRLRNDDNTTAITFKNFEIKSVTAVSAFNSDITLNTIGLESVSPTTVTLNPAVGTTPTEAIVTLTVRAKAPKNLDAIDSLFVAKAFKVGSFKVNATQTIGTTDTEIVTGATMGVAEADINMQRKNQLTIDTVKWIMRGKSQTADEEGDDVKDVKPGDKIRIEFEVENGFSNSANVDIEDVEIDIKSLDSKLDLDEDEDLGNVGSDDKESGSFEFEVDEDTDDGNYNVEILLLGKDDYGARHGQKVRINFKVERESREIAIKSVTLSPEKTGCEPGALRLVVSYVNIGKTDEDEAAVEVDAPKLNFNRKITDIQLDENDGDSSVFNILVPANMEMGIYPIEIRTFYDQSKLTDTAVATLTSVCEKETPIKTTNGKASATLSLATNSLNIKQGGSTNLGATVVNTGSEKTIYTVEVDADWAVGSESKTVTLEPGASSSLVFNLVAKSSATAGQNSAVVEVRAGSSVLSSQAVNVNVESTQTTITSAGDFGEFFGKNSTAVWVVIDIILIVIAIILIKVLFFRKAQPPRASF